MQSQNKSNVPPQNAPNALPTQQPITDDEVSPKKPSRFKTILVRVLTGVLVLFALSVGYVFLLLGEPEEESKNIVAVIEEQIRMPMNALEVPGATNMDNLADTFGQPLLAMYGTSPALQNARVFDTAFGGGYARRVVLSYAFEDNTILRVESIRPTTAITLLGAAGYTLRAGSLYTIGGLHAARMDNATQICIFGQSDTAVYAIVCPKAHEDQLNALLKQTTLVPNKAAPQ